jgi:hypothetical protein
METVQHVQHQVIFRDEYSYCAHPCICALADGAWLAVFNRAPRRPVLLHPPEDPHYYNVMIRSVDRGAAWSAPQVAPNYDWYGVECAGLTALRDGSTLLNQWRFRWYPLALARKLADQIPLVFPEDWVTWMQGSGELDLGRGAPEDLARQFAWARGDGGTYVHRSQDGGATWDETVEVDVSPFSGGYGMRGGVELASGEILLPLSDVPHYKKVFLVRSEDGGRSWSPPELAASQEGCEFEEPSLLLLPDGRLLMMLRDNGSRFLHQISSDDGGHTWSQPERLPIWGYPGHLLDLQDGRLLCVYGYRAAPYGIRAVLSYDQGKTWDSQNILVIRDDLPNRDLGYPCSVLVEAGRVFTVYYGEDAQGVTCIFGTAFSV